MDVPPPFSVAMRWPPSRFSNFSFLRSKIVVCCSNALQALQETAMAESSRKSRPTAVFRAKQSGADELRRRFANSSPMNEGEIFRCAEPRELGKRGKNLATGEPHLLHLSRCPAPARKWRRDGLKRLNPPEM